MKKNKRLLYTLGNIPEKYIDESMTEQARRTKIQWKYIVTAAACFIAIAAVPVYMIRKSINQGGNDIGTVTEISQITSDTTQTGQTEQTPVVTPEGTKSRKIPGTGPEKPADYTPEESYSIFNDGGEGFDLQDGYFVIKFLKDKSFQERINSDIREATDSLKPYFDEKYIVNSNSDDESWKNPKNTNGVFIDKTLINGYLSIVLGYATDNNPNKNYDRIICKNFDHVVVLNYDLVEQKKIESLTDLFYKDEDVLSLINNAVKVEIDNKAGVPYSLVCQTKKKDFTGFTEVPELFTINSIFFSTDNPYFDSAPQIDYNSYTDDSIVDHMIIGKNRDIEEITDDYYKYAFGDYYNYNEWNYKYSFSHENQDNFTVCYKEITGSRFHTDEEVSEYSQIYKKIQEARFKCYKEYYNFEESIPYIYDEIEDGYLIYAYDLLNEYNEYLKNVYTVSDFRGHYINIDANSFKVLSLTDIAEKIEIPDEVKRNEILNSTSIPEWHIENIIDSTAEIYIFTKDSERVFAYCDIKDINKEYFNPDYKRN